MKKSLKAYVCIATIDTDLHFGAPSITLYPSLKDLKAERSCWKECGIYELEIKVKRIVKKPKGAAL